MHFYYYVAACLNLLFVLIIRANTVDNQYIALVQHILENGEERLDRTGTGTLAVFAPPPLVFDVSHEAFPLITTKKVNLRLVAAEMFWFLSGSSSVADLQAQNVKIWNANANKFGQAGMYGLNWRFFGASYSPNIQEMMTQKHVDQIGNAIHLIMTNPTSRRIFVSAWNPIEIADHPDVLPPCHISMQFYVRKNEILDMQFFQRSVDTAIGQPFNISGYSLLLLLMAHVTDKIPGKLTYMMGDTHLYKNTIEPIRTQLARQPFPLPKLEFHTDIPRGSGLAGLLQFKYEHLKLKDYNHHPPIKMVMSA